jgi:hypothetical protein
MKNFFNIRILIGSLFFASATLAWDIIEGEEVQLNIGIAEYIFKFIVFYLFMFFFSKRN